MKQIFGIIMIITLVSLLSICGDANARGDYYWIDANRSVLVFIGDPYSLNLETAKYTTYKKQRIKLFHKKSGPGIYAFDLEGLIIQGMFGKRFTVKEKGYFLAKKRYVRKNKYKKKASMKHKTTTVFDDFMF